MSTLRDESLSREIERTLTIQKIVTESLPISTLVKHTQAGEVEVSLDMLLSRLIESLNLKWNIQPHQIKTIVEDLIDRYQYESLEDFVLIFKRARQGEFGELYRLDSAVIFGWMERYLEEKYEALERLHAKQNKQAGLNDVDILLTEALKESPALKPILPLTDEDIIREGQDRPYVKPYSTDHADEVAALAKLKVEYGRECTDLITGKTLPGKPSYNEWILLNHPPF